jgi:hypothetical protein
MKREITKLTETNWLNWKKKVISKLNWKKTEKVRLKLHW